MIGSSKQGMDNQIDTLLNQVLSAVARREHCDIHDLPPLYEAIDPDVLLRISDCAGFLDISFRYFGYTVTFNGDGTVDVSHPN